jgi:DNA ligase (NAD+)
LSDDEFDKLVDELRAENPNSPILKKVGWGYDIQNDSTPGLKYSHKYGKAGSLEKCRTWEEIHTQYRNQIVDVSAKLDGLSVVLYYEHGQLIQALTRGNGDIGIDITDKIAIILKNAISIDNDIIPKSNRFTGGIRGEIIMKNSDFAEFQKLHSDAKNPRNSAAGIINSKEITDDIKYLTVVVYSVVGCESSKSLDGMLSIRRFLAVNFSEFAPALAMCLRSEHYIEDFNELKSEWSKAYPIDGLVITAMHTRKNDNSIIQDSQAFKFKAESTQAEVIDVEWNMSKSGYAMF